MEKTRMSREIESRGLAGHWLQAWMKPQVLAMFFLGISAGMPILLIFSTLSVWLREAGVDRASVTFFSWAALAYSFKFLWAPLIDTMPLPLLTARLGRRRAWLLASQVFVMIAIVWMACTDPATGQQSLMFMALAAVLLGFSSATQDVVIDAYRIECAELSLQALLASSYVAGYRLGMLAAGAGSLYLASWLGTDRELYRYAAWQTTYLLMAGCMLCGIVTTLRIAEPPRGKNKEEKEYSTRQYLRFLLGFFLAPATFAGIFFFASSLVTDWYQGGGQPVGVGGAITGVIIEACRLLLALAVAAITAGVAVRCRLADLGMARGIFVAPIREFLSRYPLRTVVVLLALIGFYRISDIVLGVVSNVFYIDMGFSKNVIATVTKSFGLGMTLVGGFLGGVLTVRFGVYRILFSGALLAAATNLLFMLLARSGADLTLLTVVIGADNLCTGLATTAFIAFLSSLTNISFTAVQYALFSSLMTLFPKLIGGYSGTVVASWGYESFFFMTALMGLPVLLLVWLARGIIASKTDSKIR
jgi:PAT family beta-lactamase induction signal transducer AmpG